MRSAWGLSSGVADLLLAAQLAAANDRMRAVRVAVIWMMALTLGIQLHAGLDVWAVLWQVAMGAVGWRLTGKGRPLPVTNTRIKRATALSASVGLLWAVGLITWMPKTSDFVTGMIAAAALSFPAYAVAVLGFLPWAVAGFSAPLAAVALEVVWSLPGVPAFGVALVVAHYVTLLRLMQLNWRQFVRTVESGVHRDAVMVMLQEQKEIAERSVLLKTRFLATASHDLRQPMHAISIYLGGLSEMELPEKARRAVNDAVECAHDMNDMFRSLLDIARLDAGQAVPNISSFCMATVLSRVEKEFLPLARSRNVQLKVRQCAHHAYTDPVMVERIVLNFVSNAVRHTPGGRVLVGCRTSGDTLRVAVYDNGKGIPPDQQQAIFDEFHRLDTAGKPDNSGGLGLGLAIVRRLAQTLHTPVVVKSVLGRGSMFAVDLPLMHVSDRKPLPASGGATNLQGKLVVVVDDEPSILQAASIILEQAGCVVVGARSRAEALDTLANSERAPDAIVCDYELLDAAKGPAVIKALRDEFARDIPALLVTGDTSGGAEKWAREMKVPLLYKPLESATLRTSVGSLLGI